MNLAYGVLDDLRSEVCDVTANPPWQPRICSRVLMGKNVIINIVLSGGGTRYLLFMLTRAILVTLEIHSSGMCPYINMHTFI